MPEAHNQDDFMQQRLEEAQVKFQEETNELRRKDWQELKFQRVKASV